MSDDFLDKILEEEETAANEAVILAPLLEEIDLIYDPGIMTFVRSMLLKAPKVFWEGPSSFSGKYHPPDERGSHGNVLHTKRVVRVALAMAEAQGREQEELDILVAACLLHDITKGVELPDGSVQYDFMHPYTVDRMVELATIEDSKASDELSSSVLWVDEESYIEIMRLIRCHMGRWSPIPETIPVSSMEWTVHFADMLASRLHTLVDGEDVQDWRWTPPEKT